MPNVALALKEEITRLARKELRAQLKVMKKASNRFRQDIAELKRQVAQLTQVASRLGKNANGANRQPEAVLRGKPRFVAKGLRSQRERLGLSASDYAKLVG